MPFAFGVFDLALIALLAVMVAGIVVYAIGRKNKTRREQHDVAAINGAIIDYFRKTGVQVSSACASLRQDRHYTAFVESEPMKRFRLSHIIEATLRDHVRNTCGLELDKIYWRFPIKTGAADAAEPAGEVGGAAQKSDDYINEGLEHYRHIPKMEATEIDWEHFERAATGGQEKAAPSSDETRNR